MASIVDESYYTDVYKGAEVDDDLGVLLDRASDIVRQHTLCCIDDIERLPAAMQENLKKAVCAQAEYINENGGLEWLNSEGAARFSIGKFSMSTGSNSRGPYGNYYRNSYGNSYGNSRGDNHSAPLMLSYLEAAGLLYRGQG